MKFTCTKTNFNNGINIAPESSTGKNNDANFGMCCN